MLMLLDTLRDIFRGSFLALAFTVSLVTRKASRVH